MIIIRKKRLFGQYTQSEKKLQFKKNICFIVNESFLTVICCTVWNKLLNICSILSNYVFWYIYIALYLSRFFTSFVSRSNSFWAFVMWIAYTYSEVNFHDKCIKYIRWSDDDKCNSFAMISSPELEYEIWFMSNLTCQN